MRNVLSLNSDSRPTDPPIDHDQLLSRVMGNADLASRLLDKFMASAPAECDVMETAARMGDCQQLASTAHRHKGTAATMAAPQITGLAGELEKSAVQGDLVRCLELVGQLRSQHNSIRRMLSNAASGPICSSGQGERQ